jgi:hypothetical protein
LVFWLLVLLFFLDQSDLGRGARGFRRV